jgi:hypothetical protein
MMQKLAKDHPDFDATVNWIHGHEGVHGNEEADNAAKLGQSFMHHTYFEKLKYCRYWASLDLQRDSYLSCTNDLA